MNLWFVPAALGAAGFVPVALLLGRLRRELAAVQAEARRVTELRPLVAEAAGEVRATRERALELAHWTWPQRSGAAMPPGKSISDLAP